MKNNVVNLAPAQQVSDEKKNAAFKKLVEKARPQVI